LLSSEQNYTALSPFPSTITSIKLKDEKLTILWNVQPYSIVETDRRFRGAYCLHHHDDPDNGGNKNI
jgi:hypothetical protein